MHIDENFRKILEGILNKPFPKRKWHVYFQGQFSDNLVISTIIPFTLDEAGEWQRVLEEVRNRFAEFSREEDIPQKVITEGETKTVKIIEE